MKKLIVKFIDEYNPLVIYRRRKLRKSLKNKDITFLCPNCIGGILFHDLGLQFKSPTVNLMMTQTDFLKFVLKMDYYLQQEFEFFKHDEYNFPCARLDDITIHFTHYHTEEEAQNKWKERAKRINKDNLFVFLMERDGLSKEDILLLKNLNAKGVVVFTAMDYPEIEYTVKISKYSSYDEVGNILRKSHLTGVREYDRYFDFVKWFNESDGKTYNVKPYIK